jgi:carboxylesterase type B
MITTRARRARRAALSAVSAVSVAAAVLAASAGGAVASPASGGANPIVRIDGGLIRGASATGVNSFLGLPATRAAAIAAEYPLSAYPSPLVAFSLLVSDASFACPALQVDRWTAARGVPTYAYQFNDDNAPVNIVGASLGLSTHGTELPYLFDQPNAPFPAMLSPDQQALAASMRTAWARRGKDEDINPVMPQRPVVPAGAPGELRLDAAKSDIIAEFPTERARR